MAPNSDNETAKNELTQKVNAQGELVRQLKSKNAPKAEIDAAVKTLLDLKAEYKKVTGTDFPTAGRAPSKPKSESQKAKPEKKEPAKPKGGEPKESGAKKVTRLGLEATKEDNLPDWYSQVCTENGKFKS